MLFTGFTIAILALIAAAFFKFGMKNNPASPNLMRALMFIGGVSFLFGIVGKGVFYAEPGYVCHVLTVLGQETVIYEPGYKFYPFGRYSAWTRAMTVQAVSGASGIVAAEKETADTSADLPPLNIMFLDQVDANAEATARFSIPTDEDSFLKLAHEYRTPENLLRTALILAFDAGCGQESKLPAGVELTGTDALSRGRVIGGSGGGGRA